MVCRLLSWVVDSTQVNVLFVEQMVISFTVLIVCLPGHRSHQSLTHG